MKDLLEMIEEAKEPNSSNKVKTQTPIYTSPEEIFKKYFTVKYKDETVKLYSLPFSY